MATSVSLNGGSTNYSIPATGDSGWGDDVSNYLVAISTNCLNKAGGTFTLTADVDFGGGVGAKGLKTSYYKSQGTNPGTTGVLRLANAESVVWRNAANNADLGLAVNASNNLQYNAANVLTAGTGLIVNADISASAAIAYSKLALTNSIVNGDVASAAGITYAKLNLAGGIVNADVASGAAIAYSKLGLTGGVVNADISGSAAIAYSKLALTGSVVNADISAGAAIAYSKLNLASSVATGDLAAALLVPTTKGGTGLVAVQTTPLASTFAGWDANSNLSASNHIEGYATTVTAAGTTTLVVGSKFLQYFTGTAAQTVLLPVASTLVLGQQFQVVNLSTGTVSVQSSGANLVQAVTTGTTAVFTCILTSGTTAASWSVEARSGSGGGGSGEKNYLATGTSNATNWAASGSITVATDTTPSNMPRPNTTASAIQLTGGSSTTAYAYYRFILDDADANKKLKVQFDMKPGTMAAGDFQVDVYSNTASDYTTGNTRLALSTDSSGASLLPVLTGTYRTTFDAPAVAAKYIEVRIKTPASHTHTLDISDIVVGPGVVVQGAAVTTPASWTPTGSWSTNTTYTGRKWRVGNYGYYEVKIALAGAPTSATLTVNMPSGETIDTTNIVDANRQQLGEANMFLNAGSSTGQIAGLVRYNTTTNVGVITLPAASGTAHYEQTVTDTVPATFASGDYITLKWRVPVAEFAGSGTVNVVQNDVEYAYNSSTATGAGDSISFAYGPGGAQIQSISTAINRRVRFLTPIRSGDQITVEVSEDQAIWNPIQNYYLDAGNAYILSPYVLQNGVAYGMGRLHKITGSATDLDIGFGTYSYPSGATYGAAGTLWSAGANAAYWRVKKSSGGQAVGFSEVQPGVSSGLVSANGLKGVADTSSAPTGYVGERINSFGSSVSVSTSGFTTITSITLTPGDWDLSFIARAGGVASALGLDAGIATAPASSTGWVAGDNAGSGVVTSTSNGCVSIAMIQKSISASTTYYLTAQAFGTALSCAGRLTARRVR